MKLPYTQRVKLSLGIEVVRVIILIVLILGIILSLTEYIVRTDRVQSQLFGQAYGTGHVQLDVQIERLKAYVEAEGAPECFVVGNSMTLRAIDPEILGAGYMAQTDEPLDCFNFSVNGNSLVATSMISQFLIHQYKPKVLVLGINFMDFSASLEDATNRRVLQNDWIHYQLGESNLSGWLLELSLAYRALKLLSYGSSTQFDYTEIKNQYKYWQKIIGPVGFCYTGQTEDVTLPLTENRRDYYLRKLGDLSFRDKNMEALDELIGTALELGVSIIIAEVPYHEKLITLEVEAGVPTPGMDKRQQFVEWVHTELTVFEKRYGFSYIPFDFTVEIPNNGWKNHSHVNTTGATIFSRWLGEQISKVWP